MMSSVKSLNFTGGVAVTRKTSSGRSTSRFSSTCSKSSSPAYLSSKLSFDPLMLSKIQAKSSFGRSDSFQVQSNSGVADGEAQEGSKHQELSAQLVAPTSMAALGSSFGGSAVLEKTGLNLTQKEESFQLNTDDGSGGGGMGKDIHNGGGGDGDDGDDDDYFDDEGDEEGDENMFTRREAIPEIFDRASIEAVLQEWMKTLYSLPYAVRIAVEMGIVSTAQLVNFISLDARPTLIRAVTRNTPQAFSREFVGRLMGDPAFLGKLAFEQVTTLAVGLTYEMTQRQQKFTSEMDLAAVNIAAMMATNLAFMWCLTANRSVGNMHKFSFQRILHGLPNHVFDRAGPQRNFTTATRAAGMVVKAAQLSAVGTAIGAASGAASNSLVNLRRRENPDFVPALASPSVSTTASGNGAFAGLSGSVRYNLVAGMDMYLQTTFNSLPLVLTASALGRILNTLVGEPTRLYWQGLPMKPPRRERKKVMVVKKKKKVSAGPAAAEAPQGFSVSAAAIA